jgi:peptidoglycan hydrolase-like protein with peptidoglycan-binding domain
MNFSPVAADERVSSPEEGRATSPDAARAELGLMAFVAPSVGSSPATSTTIESAVVSGDVLETGDQGPAVRDVQRRLTRLGYRLSADGGFGPYTKSKVQDFQRDHNVAPTGAVGRTTLMSLRMAEAQRSDIAIADLFPSVGPGGHLKLGSSGVEVETLQKMLNYVGASLTVDGSFGQATKIAVQDFQRSAWLQDSGEFGPTTLAKLDARVDALYLQERFVFSLPEGYQVLEKLAGDLASRDRRFSRNTPQGRAALSIALAIGGTEVHGRHTTATDFFTRLGGAGNNMLGFAQFNLAYHSASIQSPNAYTKHLADILSGVERMPNAAAASNHARALADAVTSGQVQNGADLKNFLWNRGFGGSNWQGIDDGWGRNPGLADALVNYLRGGRGAGNV